MERSMNQLMTYAGHAEGILGALVCLVSGLARVSGSYHFANFEATTLFMVGVGLMVFACMMKLELLSRGG
jgi:hypothetical protein